ncbi:hypothetical protein V8G54_036189 [Vigna mungo]|uniref:Uncharacterized protein n=1 Tax=Vigna mungo TaxID=3915 RepID=A0AAQ3MGJ8_VIGMU
MSGKLAQQIESSEKLKEHLEVPCETTVLRGDGEACTVETPLDASEAVVGASTNRISLSIATVSFIVGRSSALVLTHSNETARVCNISCTVESVLPLSVGSRMSDGSPFLAKWFLTH